MITYKRIKDDKTALALYYDEIDISIRYEIDITLYNKIPTLKWSTYYNYPVLTSSGISLAAFIVTNGQYLQRGEFIHFKDGNNLNLRQSNLQILKRNEYIINGDETQLIVHSVSNCTITRHIVLFDTVYYDHVKIYSWSICNGYARTIVNEPREYIKLHQYIIHLREGLDSSLVVDHKDKNKLNNKSINLRQVTRTVNNRNCIYSNRKPDAILGVCKEGGKWIAQAGKDSLGKRRKASFSINKYGEEKAKQLAIDRRIQWEKELNITSIIETT